jgi:hypothetical protein
MNAPADSTPVPATPKKKCRCLRRFLVFLIVLLAVLHVATPLVARKLANDKLPGILRTEASLGDFSLNLARGHVGLGDLAIAQPEGFAGEPLLELGSVSVAVPPLKALRQDPLVVGNVRLDGLTLRLVSDTNGVLNVSRLGPEKTEETEPKEEGAPPPPVFVEDVLLENIRFSFRDEANGLEVAIEEFNLSLANLALFGAQPGKEPAEVAARFLLSGPRNAAQVGLRGKIGPVENGKVPALQLCFALIGFDLGTVEPLLTRGARTAIGGDGFDLTVFVEIGPGATPADQQVIYRYTLVTDKGSRLSNELSGTLAKLDNPLPAVLGDVFGNVGGRFGRFGVNVAQGGVEVVKGAAATGVAAVKGAAGTVKGLAGGAFQTLKGVATLDGDMAMGGLRDATVGTMTNLAGTVTGTVGAAGDGLGKTAGTALGQDDAKAWWLALDARREQFNQDAAAWFAERPFPVKP